VVGIQGFLTSVALVALLVVTWPLGEPVLTRSLIALGVISIPSGLRTLCFIRSDETWKDRAALVLLRPLSALWAGLVLSRCLRTWGTMTLLKQGWTTRKRGAEIRYRPGPPESAAARALASREAAA
jgi:hypothetical protein